MHRPVSGSTSGISADPASGTAVDDPVEDNLRRAYLLAPTPVNQGDRFDDLLVRLATRLGKSPPKRPA